MYSHPSFFLSFCWVDPPESGRLALHAQSFLVDLIVDEELNKRINQNIYILNKFALYILFCFILLFTSSSPCRKDQIAVLWCSTSYYCTAPGLLLGVPAPLNRMLLWACWYFILWCWATLIIITIIIVIIMIMINTIIVIIIVTIIWATVSGIQVSLKKNPESCTWNP